MCTRTNCPALSRVLVASVGLFIAAAAAPGAVILQAGGWEVEVDDTMVSDVDVYVDFMSLDGNVLVIEQFAQFRNVSPMTGRPDPINFTFRQVSPDAETISRIAINNGAFTNLTGVEWSDFEMALFGGATYDTALSSNFSFNPFTSSAFSDGDTVVTFGTGGVADGTTWFPGAARGELVFNIDLSGDNQVINATLLPLPLPAPGTVTVAGLACGLILRRRRR